MQCGLKRPRNMQDLQFDKDGKILGEYIPELQKASKADFSF